MSFQVTAGSGTSIAADLIGTGSAPTTADEVQYVKLDYGTTSNSVPVNVTHGLPVQGQGSAGTASGGVVTVQGVASMTPFLCSQSGTWNVTNVSGTVSLPTGAATAAKQPALGTAGTASTDVISVQGIASMTPVQVSQSGTWNITNVSGTISLPTGASTAAKQPALGTAGSASADVITVQGVASMTPILVSLSGSNTLTTVTTVTTVSTVTVVSAVTAITNALPAGTNTIGNVGSVPLTSGGTTTFHFIAAAGSNQDQQQVKASAGQIYGYQLFNTTASALRYVKIYNKAAPTSSDTPIKTILVPPSGGANLALPVGIACGTAIGIRITTGYADNDTGAVTAGDVIVNLDYA